MALMEWTDQLELGVERMDDTHREFVAQLNALHVAPQEEFLPLLDAFIEHTQVHFGQEQHWMSEIDFPPIHCHVREHEGVLEVMRKVRRMVSEGKTEVGRVLTRELAPWFENHAKGMDAMLAFFLRCIAAGVDPMKALAAQSAHVCGTDGSAQACVHADAACPATQAHGNERDASAAADDAPSSALR